MTRLTRSPACLVASLGLTLIAGSAHAVVVLGNGDSINLGALMGPGSDRTVIVADKMFQFESFTSSQFSASYFSVIGFVSGSTNQWGLHNVGFDLTGPFGDGDPGSGLVHEQNLQYTVSVLPEYYAQGIRLHDCRLTFNGSAGGDGSFSRVDETIIDADQNQFLKQLSVFDTAMDTGNLTRLVDGVDFSPNGYRAFEVNKDMKFFAAHREDFATASFIRQEFSQVPAPGVAALLGLSGMVASRRRRA